MVKAEYEKNMEEKNSYIICVFVFLISKHKYNVNEPEIFQYFHHKPTLFFSPPPP